MLEKHLINVISSALTGDKTRLELATISLMKSVRKENPTLATKIGELLAESSFSRGNYLRTGRVVPPPVDAESQLEMVQIEPPDASNSPRPIFDSKVDLFIDVFLDERNHVQELLKNGLKPSNSIILTGEPGTGKTMLARYIASALNKNLVILDLSSSISSFLGRTGTNLKKVLTYARDTGSVLLLDEFDAIAKKRDDSSDLGEIKRIVNILLMELENWPTSSVLIATSNHPELLDRAVWRRFDHAITIELPGTERINLLLTQELIDFTPVKDDPIIQSIGALLEGNSPADVCRYTNNVKRRLIIKKDTLAKAMIGEIADFSRVKNARGRICEIAKAKFGQNLSVRDLAALTGLSPSGVQHHLAKSKTTKDE